jgi:hypothetical protein
MKQFLGSMHTGSDEEMKKTETGPMDWWQIFTMLAYRNSSHNTTSD